MSRSFFDPYHRTYEFVRKDLTTFGSLGVMNLVVAFAASMIYQVLITALNFLMFIPIVIIVVGILLMTQGTVGLIFGIVITILGVVILIAMFLAMMGTGMLIGVVGAAMNLLISEKLKLMKKGYVSKLEALLKEGRKRWKELMNRGAKLFLAYLAISFPVMMCLSLVSGGIMIAFIVGIPLLIADPAVSFIIMIFALILLSFLTVLLYPIFFVLMFIYDMTSLRMVEGKSTGIALRMSIKDIKYNRKGVFMYCLGLMGSIMVMMMIFPLAFIGQGFLGILTKSFIISNRKMFRDHS
ncbi:MAG: hypothetical protein U9R75_08495 [Candidatus Thermoplasmatota archaeon]|nr:hypothetical protein [Candidatus Thermoplasmatota archaeon]